MPEGAVCVFTVFAQNGPAFETPHCGIGYTASVDIERSWLPRLAAIPPGRRMGGGGALVAAAGGGGAAAFEPQSQRQAMWPPHASTAFGPFAVKRTFTRDSDDP